MGKDVMIACDFASMGETLDFLDLFKEEKPYVKLGMEIFYAEGPEIVREIKRRGHKIFLDLKLHDIPNTVKKAMSSLARLDVDMVNLHAGGGTAMMAAAKEGLSIVENPAELIAVTILTSIDENRMQQELGVAKTLPETVNLYASNAKKAGLSGVVCSPLESPVVHEVCGPDFLTITPGVRFAEDEKGDQSRVTTPAKARELGSDYIVVGRSITQAKDPVDAYRRMMRDFVDVAE